MLSKKMQDALNKQIAMEAFASSSYLSMAIWCETKGLRGATAFFYDQSDEERMHMLKLIKYVNEAGGHAKVPSIKEPPATYKSLKDVVEIALHHEKAVTKSIGSLVEMSFTGKEFATYNFLQWYVAEQHEEESLFQTLLDLIALGGTEGKNLLIVDNEIAKIRAQHSVETEA